jgi:hypothetical protein
MTVLLQRGILSTPRRSSRLAAKSRARISKPHLQAIRASGHRDKQAKLVRTKWWKLREKQRKR